MKDTRLGYVLKQAQQAVRAEMLRALKEFGITLPQYAALSALERCPAISNADLARQCFVTPQTMVRISKSLEESRLITRTAHPTHGRVIVEELTAKGKDLLVRCHEVAARVEERIARTLSSRERKEIVDVLLRIVESLEG